MSPAIGLGLIGIMIAILVVQFAAFASVGNRVSGGGMRHDLPPSTDVEYTEWKIIEQ